MLGGCIMAAFLMFSNFYVKNLKKSALICDKFVLRKFTKRKCLKLCTFLPFDNEQSFVRISF